ncbi:MAG: glycoside hydrolase family 13 protein [Chloroflexi bacterium]|nr:glycoside hydrolase family 13 protein [Chloroflexota bacterium]
MSITTPDWVKDAVFYQIFPDRFAKSERVSKQGLKLEPWDSPPTVYGFKGGDLLGIVEHLDYLQDLGVNALYLNPITASASNHRYHTYDYFKVDPLLGGDAAFRELLDAAHARGMRVVPDGVFNHASRGIWQFHHVLENGDGSPYVDWFHFNSDHLNGKKHWGAYPTLEEQDQLKNGVASYEALGYRAWWNFPALPKLNTNTPAVREFIFDAAVHWIKFGADGWRLDVPAEIDDDSFWQEFRRRVKAENPDAYIVGEIWHESKRWLQGDQFDAVMNYLVTGALMGWLIGDRLPDYIFRIGDYHKYLRAIKAEEFADRIDYLLGLYDPAINYAQFNLLDSHDTPRFVTTSGGDLSALKLGWLFLFTYVGAPCIYYGDEIGMAGGPDPACRGSFSWNMKEWDVGVIGYAKSLISLRLSQPALRRGDYKRLYAKGNIYAFSRSTDEETVIVAINAGANTAIADLPAPPQLADGPLTTLFGEAQAQVTAGQVRGLKLAPRSGVVLGKQST